MDVTQKTNITPHGTFAGPGDRAPWIFNYLKTRNVCVRTDWRILGRNKASQLVRFSIAKKWDLSYFLKLFCRDQRGNVLFYPRRGRIIRLEKWNLAKRGAPYLSWNLIDMMSSCGVPSLWDRKAVEKIWSKQRKRTSDSTQSLDTESYQLILVKFPSSSQFCLVTSLPRAADSIDLFSLGGLLP